MIQQNYSSCQTISIHALTRSATPNIHGTDEGIWNFNPRTHKECDLPRKIFASSPINFNPRTHKECDLNH